MASPVLDGSKLPAWLQTIFTIFKMFHFLIPLAIVVYLVSRAFYNYFRPGISHIPGPFICKFSDAYRTYRAKRGDQHLWLMSLHQKYGNLVRIGPNTVLDSEQGEYQRVFGFKEDYEKSDSIKVWQSVVNGQEIKAIVSAQDRGLHARLRRPVAGLYSNTNVVAYQPRVVETVKYLVKRLDEEFMRGAMAGRACDIDNWVQYFAFDIVGQFTLSRRLGFLEQGHDVGGMLNELHKEFEYRGTVQNMPWLDKLFRKNPLYMHFFKPTTFFSANSRRLVTERMADEKQEGMDFLIGFLEAQKKHPEVVDMPTLFMYINTNFLAGSDTTSVTMRSIIYFLLKNPETLKKLREELDASVATYPPDYQTAMSLKYTDAVLREALRLHPIGSLVFERVVPAQGHTTTESETRFPPGMQIAMTPWTINFDEKTFGPEPRKFRPERWLQDKGESDEAFEKRLNALKHNELGFSFGPRACLGRHIAWLELVTVIPTLFGLLDIELAEPNKEWTHRGAFFSRQYDMDVRMKWRQGVDKSQILD